eukprot:SAG22_NODE_83_length_21704_cov_58.556584_20_plen_332_part_00
MLPLLWAGGVLLQLSAGSATVLPAAEQQPEATTSFPCADVAACGELALWHIPGPNPIVSPWNPSGKAAWMSTECEVAGGVQKVNSTTYVFVYHCLGTTGYQVGMSTATSPLGPWTLPPTEPTLGVTAGAWDKDVVASFNIIPDPDKPGAWLGYFEGGMPASGKEDWSLGVARAPGPLGPWTKHAGNPILDGNKTCDPSREFKGHCGGLYVGSVLHGSHTNNEYWIYMEVGAPAAPSLAALVSPPRACPSPLMLLLCCPALPCLLGADQPERRGPAGAVDGQASERAVHVQGLHPGRRRGAGRVGLRPVLRVQGLVLQRALPPVRDRLACRR